MTSIKDNWIKLDSEAPGTRSGEILKALKREIIGQDSVMEDIADSLDTSQAGFRDSHKPRYVGLFLGPKGVGKTLTAKVLGLIMLGKKTSLTRIDCQLLSEEHSISKLIGSPAGYVGHKDTIPWLAQEHIDRHSKLSSSDNQKQKELAQAKKALTELEDELHNMLEFRIFANQTEKAEANLSDSKMDIAIRHLMIKRKKIIMYVETLEASLPKGVVVTSERPVSILLLDEIEKAHRKIFNALLGVCEEGQMMMSSGAITYFDNCYIIMTSNAGSSAISELLYTKKKPIGYELWHEDTKAKKDLDDNVYKKATKAAEEIFPPEFLDRCDRISVFRPLSAESISKIFDIELRNFENEHTKPLFISLDLAPEVKNFIVKEATDHPGNGARLLNKKIHKHLTRQLARIHNRGEIQAGDTIHMVLDSSNPKNPRVEYYREPTDNITPILIEAGLDPDGEIPPTLDSDGTLRNPGGNSEPNLNGGDDPIPDEGNSNPDDDYDGIPAGPKIRK